MSKQTIENKLIHLAEKAAKMKKIKEDMKRNIAEMGDMIEVVKIEVKKKQEDAFQQ